MQHGSQELQRRFNMKDCWGKALITPRGNVSATQGLQVQETGREQEGRITFWSEAADVKCLQLSWFHGYQI